MNHEKLRYPFPIRRFPVYISHGKIPMKTIPVRNPIPLRILPVGSPFPIGNSFPVSKNPMRNFPWVIL